MPSFQRHDSYSLHGIRLTFRQLPISRIKLLRGIAVQSLPEPSQSSQDWLKSLALLEMDK